LADKLDKLARAAAVGGLAVTAAFIALPGAAGTVVSNVSTANTLNNMVRDSSAAQLMDVNRQKLGKVGIASDLADEFLTNRFYTPVDLTVMVDALARMGSLQHIDVLVDRAVSANSRDIAYFFRKRIEMTAAYQQRTRRLAGFMRFGNSPFPLAVTVDNGIVGAFPIDILSWTRDTSQAITAMTTAAQNYGFTGPKLLTITGKVTPMAKKNLVALGWKVEENDGN
jgi:hypothetical protein